MIIVGSEIVVGNIFLVLGKCCVLVSSRVNFVNFVIGLLVVFYVIRVVVRVVEVIGIVVGDVVVKWLEKSGGKESVCCCFV